MTTSTLLSYEVQTYASKTDRRTITVLAKDAVAARAKAITGHRNAAGLGPNASVLTLGCRVIDPLLALERAGGVHGDDAA